MPWLKRLRRYWKIRLLVRVSLFIRYFHTKGWISSDTRRKMVEVLVPALPKTKLQRICDLLRKDE